MTSDIANHDEGSCTLVFADGTECLATYFLSWNANRDAWELNLKPAESVLDRYPIEFLCRTEKGYSFKASGLDSYNNAMFEDFEPPMTAQQFRDDYLPKRS